MIKGVLDSDLAEKGFNSEYFFFYQVWRELTCSKTLDSYQHKSLNVINGLEELIHNLESYIDSVTSTTHSIISLNAELFKLLSRDYVLRTIFPSVLNRLRAYLGQSIKTIPKCRALKYHVSLLLHEIQNTYDAALVECLVERIHANDMKNTYQLTSFFISRCIDKGWSIKALSRKMNLSDGKDVKDLLQKIICSHSQKYIVVFPYRLTVLPPSGKTKEESTLYVDQQLNRFGIRVENKKELTAEYQELNLSKYSCEKFIIVSCNAKDIYGASNEAIKNLSSVLNAISFFSAIEPWSINNISWTVFNTEAPYQDRLSPKDIYGVYEYLDSSTMVYNRVREILTQSTLTELKQRIASAISYTNLSHISLSEEEKYINMWIALESLIRINSFESIIENIKYCIPKACTIRYIYKLIRNFSEDCARCGVSLSFDSIIIDLDSGDKEKIVKNMLTVLRTPEMAEVLKQRCTTSQILSYRFKEIRQLATDFNELQSQTKSYHATVEWHLDRLYRIRNEIAHTAFTNNPSLLRYSEHLYDYLASTISEITRIAKEKESKSFEEIISAINANYDEFVGICNEKTAKSNPEILGRLWQSGIMDFI